MILSIDKTWQIESKVIVKKKDDFLSLKKESSGAENNPSLKEHY